MAERARSVQPELPGMQPLPEPCYAGENLALYGGNCLDILPLLPQESVDMIFADPPYHLSNGGFTCKSGRRVPVHKGKWDESNGLKEDHGFHLDWLRLCRGVLKADGTIWVSGTYHSIYSIGFALQQLGFRILNDVVWYKPNAPPNLGCRCFTASHETLLWAARDSDSRHVFNYEDMKRKNKGKQMRSFWKDIQEDLWETVWNIPTPAPREKQQGSHPTQKPLMLLRRLIEASTREGELVLDPFAGSGTTGVAALELKRRFIGIEQSEEYIELSTRRFEQNRALWIKVGQGG